MTWDLLIVDEKDRGETRTLVLLVDDKPGNQQAHRILAETRDDYEHLDGCMNPGKTRAIVFKMQDVDGERDEFIDVYDPATLKPVISLTNWPVGKIAFSKDGKLMYLQAMLETGTPITVLQRKTLPPYRVLQLGLTLPRDQLYARIDARVERMVDDGLLAEVRALLEAGYTWECPAMSGLGYIQWRPYLDGAITLPDVIAAIQNETHAFVRRQYTWFSGHNSGLQWLNASQAASDDVIALIRHWLSTEGI